ncbi:MAG: P-loop NTPase [Deltaproteobacteria bacterium]|nr:P-loop NTPase [Deltaproteobacteria bacterium]MBN2673338.1 P-loop NTPase [Deltaproteobacteria bacterium]
MNKPAIIPVAGGKGGIGKSIIAANIAVTLASQGHNVVAMDLDLGASNLHAILGIKNSEKNIMNFATNHDVTLEQMVLPTRYSGTKIICGAANIAGAADIPATQKLRIIHNIETLQADYVILDLGGGSSFNVTDFFLTGEMGVIVVVPEITSLLDAYSFLKTTLYRRLQMEWQHEPEIRSLIEQFKNPKNVMQMQTTEDLLKHVRLVSEETEHEMRMKLQSYGVRVVVNKVRQKKDFQVARTIQQLAMKNLNLSVYNTGYVPYDPTVEHSVNKMVPFVQLFPQSAAAHQISQLARSLTASPSAA